MKENTNLKIKEINISSLKYYERNTKKHPKEQIKKIANSIKEFGFNVPILADKENNIIAGHGRVLASKELGIKKVPIIRIEHLTPKQVKAFRIADNKVTESEWDYDFLKDELSDLKTEGFDLELIGFSDEEMGDVLGFKEEAEEDDFDVGKSLKEPKYKVKKGDLFGLGAYILVDGKKVEVEVL